jgi:hypothetical protein
VIYIDTSAFLKLVRAEDETEALREFLAEHRRPLISSVLLRLIVLADVDSVDLAVVLFTTKLPFAAVHGFGSSTRNLF